MEADITSQAVGLGANTDFSLMSLFLRADIIVKLVMIILIVCSIYSWAVIIDKIRLFKSGIWHITFDAQIMSVLFLKLLRFSTVDKLKK